MPGGPAVAPPGRIWIDTDAACGATTRTDPDDCLAILWLAERGVDIIGISTSFGNAPGDVVADRTGTRCEVYASISCRLQTLRVAIHTDGTGFVSTTHTVRFTAKPTGRRCTEGLQGRLDSLSGAWRNRCNAVRLREWPVETWQPDKGSRRPA